MRLAEIPSQAEFDDVHNACGKNLNTLFTFILSFLASCAFLNIQHDLNGSKLIAGLGSVQNAYLGEMFVNGQNKNRWCDSGKTMNLLPRVETVYTCKSPMCFMTMINGVALAPSHMFGEQFCEGDSKKPNSGFLCTPSN